MADTPRVIAEAFALLDDAGATAQAPKSRLFTHLVREHRCEDPKLLDATCAAVQADMDLGLHALLLADYEWGVRLIGADVARADLAAGMLRVLMFRRCDTLSKDEVDRWLLAQAPDAQGAEGAGEAAGFFGWKPSVDREEFMLAVQRIQELIAAGETYQINYSYRLDGWALGEPCTLYRMLRRRQPVPFGALIRLAGGKDSSWVLSLSPELFLRFDGARFVARPMKGTAACPSGDVAAAARTLSADPKNRAENVMIVDLLRNDLGRVARPGTVWVPRLFEVERHGSVLQMTSSVEAIAADRTTLADVLRAAFPCGSITGAPKKRSVELIAGIESTPRGLYTGAIGWLEPAADGAAMGPFCLSVAIRTVTLGPLADGLRPARFGVGSGIVWDSAPRLEHEECELKGSFVTRSPAGFRLLETMYAARRRIPLWERHLSRLRASAAELGFGFDEPQIRSEVGNLAQGLGVGAWRIRLCLQSDGHFDLAAEPLVPLAASRHRLLLAPLPGGLPARLARFKTTVRCHYDEGIRQAVAAGAFDTLFHTADGRLVEGGRSNVLLCLHGRWYTPPVQDGALPGVLRSFLLETGWLSASERTLHVHDLKLASGVIACNALRGALRIAAVGNLEFDTEGQRLLEEWPWLA